MGSSATKRKASIRIATLFFGVLGLGLGLKFNLKKGVDKLLF